MCGLIAMLTVGGMAPSPRTLEQMAASIRHRGPDDSGVLVQGPVGLAFRRLSILDLSLHGHQPMVARDAPVSLVFNGEIYNFIELRAELLKLGHQFQSSGDTEVLLRSYLQWGTDCVHRFNGMWAFVIHDQRSGRLFGSRDRFGVKPLYHCRSPRGICFASEVKALFASGELQARANDATVADFLVTGRLDHTHATFFQGVNSVPAGHSFEVDYDGLYRQWSYWRADDSQVLLDTPDKAFGDLFEDAIRLHLRSDVPLAVHLSGGLDSTAIACAAARARTGPSDKDSITAFCYQDPDYDESPYIESTIAQTGANKVALSRTPLQLWETLPQVVQAHDEPFHSFVAVVSYELMRITKEHGIKVVLNGQGADETLGGYGSYFERAWHSHLVQGQWATLWRNVSQWSSFYGQAALPVLSGIAKRFLKSSLSEVAWYRRASADRWRAELATCDWVTPAARSLVAQPAYARPDLDSTLAWSITTDPLPLYLRIEDRNSSAHSIEGRVPFLDYRLVNLAFSLSVDWRLRGPLNKYVLREAMRGRIPEKVRARVDKMGFPVGLSQWMRKTLQQPLRDLMSDPDFKTMPEFNAARLSAMLDEHRDTPADHSVPIFRAVQMYHWKKHLQHLQRTASAQAA